MLFCYTYIVIILHIFIIHVHDYQLVRSITALSRIHSCSMTSITVVHMITTVTADKM